MGFYQHCDDPECTYDDVNEGRTRLDAPTLRETLLNRYRCHKCNALQSLHPYAKEQAMEEWFDKMEALEARVEELEARLDLQEADMEKELETLLQNTGDGIATLFEQMLKGEWKDENGHDVKLNAAMWNMRDVLREIMAFRAKHLGYTAPATGG